MKYLFGNGEKNPNWNGGKVITSNGYVLIKRPNHPQADCRGYIYEHRLVAEIKFGRSILKSEKIHHIDGNKKNNFPENIEICNGNAEHYLKHRKPNSKLRLPNEKNIMIFCSCGCGIKFEKYDREGRPRKFISGHNRINEVKNVI